jgi:hypothetical protein
MTPLGATGGVMTTSDGERTLNVSTVEIPRYSFGG